MVRLFAILLFVTLLSGCARIPDAAWEDARAKLEAMRNLDQQYRKSMDSVGRKEGWQSKAIADLWEKQRRLDSVNLEALDELISRFGYPPRSKVGDLCQVPFDLLRHSDESIRAQYVDMIVGAARDGDLLMRDAAAFQDEVLMMQRVPQEYGTQVWIEYKENRHTGDRYDSLFLWPVRDLPNIDARRHSVGLDSLSQHLRRFGMDPKLKYLIRKSDGAPQ